MGHRRRRLCGRGRRLAGFAGAGCTVESVVGMSVDAAAGVRVVAKGDRDDDRDHDRDEDEGAATWNASTEVDHLLWYRAALSGRSPRRRCMRAPNRRGDRSKRSSEVGADAAAAQIVAVEGLGDHAPDNWEVVSEFEGVQMTAQHVAAIDDPDAVERGDDDVPEMLELVRETDPGPFLKRTIELGRYLEIRRGGELVAMAGERLHFEGWREVSVVCTAPSHRGQGLASRLVSALVSGIHERSERAFLNVLSTNTDAIRLYEQLGFCVRGAGR